MNEFKKVVESYGNFKVSNLGNGLTRIHAHNDKFTLGVICAEDKIRGSIKTKDGVDLYSTKVENISLGDIKTKLSELCMMYSRATAAFESDNSKSDDVIESVKDSTKSDLEKEDDDKEVLLDDTIKDEVLPGMSEVETGKKVVVGMSGRIVASDEGEKETSIDDIVVEKPVTEIKEDTVDTAEDTGLKDSIDSDEEISVEDKDETDEKSEDETVVETEDETADVDVENKEEESSEESENKDVDIKDDNASENKDTIVDEKVVAGFDDASKKLVDIADSISSLVSKFDDAEPDRKLIATGLSSTMYSVACDLKSFVDEFLINSEIEKAKENDEAVNESVAVPAKTSYIDIARGGINQARLALGNNKDNSKIKTILDILSDIDSELVTQFD